MEQKKIAYSSVITGIGLVRYRLGINQIHGIHNFGLCTNRRGNGIFQPSANTIATEYALEKDMELGMVMGSVGAAGAFAEFLVQSRRSYLDNY